MSDELVNQVSNQNYIDICIQIVEPSLIISFILQIVESLTETADQGSLEERQQALMQLVTSDKVNAIMIDRILASAEKAKL